MLIGCTTGHIVDGCRIQRKTNGKYNRTCDQRWEKLPDLFNKQTTIKQQYRRLSVPQYGRHIILSRYSLHRRNIRKTDTIIIGKPEPIAYALPGTADKAEAMWSMLKQTTLLDQNN